MDKLKSIKIKYKDGTYSDEIPIGVLAEYVDYNDTKTLKQVLDLDVTKGTVEERLNKQSNDISSMSTVVDNANENANVASGKADAVNTRLDNIIIESGTSEAEVVAARTNANTGVTYTTLAQRLDSENSEIKEDLSQNISTILGNNVFSVKDADITSKAGVRFVADATNGTITANGTSTGANSIFTQTFTVKQDGTYTITGCPAGGSTSKYYIRIKEVSGNDIGNGVQVELVANTTYTLWVVIGMSRTVTNLVFTPSITYGGTTLNSLADSVDNLSGMASGLLASRFITNNAGTPLTILHISDIHSDSDALRRIEKEAEKHSESIGGKICTGDMVANTGGNISSWWNASFMTCVGNHDSATTSGTTYNWNGVSMANREAYYITPYEDSWGDIVHTNGTSYYYKDYATEKVRLIVIDAMLYTGTTMETEATAQTAWLADALAGAISAGLHVLIATHAPHGGAEKVESSFSQNWQAIMPTQADCDTPQTVIDTVAQAITNGLHFIGYLCGHTHRDVLWDATGDKSQLMYCITCANVDTPAQWRVGDLYRDIDRDAYNLVTIDTTNTIVKIVRGGGADISNDMRTRKGICINYTTGDIVGEIL